MSHGNLRTAPQSPPFQKKIAGLMKGSSTIISKKGLVKALFPWSFFFWRGGWHWGGCPYISMNDPLPCLLEGIQRTFQRPKAAPHVAKCSDDEVGPFLQDGISMVTKMAFCFGFWVYLVMIQMYLPIGRVCSMCRSKMMSMMILPRSPHGVDQQQNTPSYESHQFCLDRTEH